MIYFTLTLTYQQLCLLASIDRRECAPNRKEDTPFHETPYGKFTHFLSHVRALQKNGLIQHHEPIKGKKRGGYTITPRGELTLELFKSDLVEASTLNILASKPPKMIQIKKRLKHDEKTNPKTTG